MKKEITIGILVGLFTTAAGMFLYFQYGSRYGFEETIQLAKEGEMFGKILTLAALPNLGVFFIYLKKKQEYRARGVLLAMFLLALCTFALKLL